MATVPHKAFYAHLESDHEVLTMDEHGAILFRNAHRCPHDDHAGACELPECPR